MRKMDVDSSDAQIAHRPGAPIMSKLTHISEAGEARMVDVCDKAPRSRKAIAQGGTSR